MATTTRRREVVKQDDCDAADAAREVVRDQTTPSYPFSHADMAPERIAAATVLALDIMQQNRPFGKRGCG